MISLRQTAAAAALALATFLGASVPTPAAAAEYKDFDQAAFEAAEAQGRPVLIDVSAWWCPVCAVQLGTIRRTTVAAAYDKLTIFHVNYDREPQIWKSFGVHTQGTLIGFDHGHEVGRLAYVTDRAQINALLASLVQ